MGNATGNTATSARTDAVAAATSAVTATSAATGGADATTSSATAAAADSLMSPAAVLTYFLQHGSLPLSAPTLTPPQLLAGFPAWLAQGWRGLRPVLQAGGPAALHRLARLLAEPLLRLLLRLAVPGQVRPVQGVLEAAWQQPATRAAGHTRPDLWAHTFGYLLREDFQSFSSPVFQQWLTQQLATAATEQAAADIASAFSAAHASATGPGALPAPQAPANSGLRTTASNELIADNTAASSSARPADGTFADTPPGAGQAPAAGNGLSLLQAQQVMQYHLAEGGVPPWWPGSAASPARLRTLLAQVLRTRPLPDFLRNQPLPAEARQRLAALADFAQLAGLLSARRLPSGAPPTGAPLAALAGLERREAPGAAGHPSGWLLLLRTAYLDFYLDAGPSTMATRAGLAGIRQLAAHYQLPVPATLGKIRRLLGTQPALLANAFFASLNQLLPHPVVAKAAWGTPNATPAAPELLPATPEPFPATEKASRAEENPSRRKQHPHPTTETSSRGAENPADAPAQGYQVPERLTEMPAGVAARDLVFYLLRYQRLPWWAPASLTPAHQRQLLTQVAHEYRAGLQALVQAHRTEPAFRQMLAELASFAQLARFVASPGRATPGRLAPAVLAALDQQLARAGEPVARLLRQAYLTAAFHPNPADIRTLAAGVRAQATRTGTAWRTVLRSVAWLHRQLPALATAPFFAALLAAAATYEQVAGQSRASSPGARSKARPISSAQSQSAATAFQALEEYLRTGQAPGLAAGGNSDESTTGSTSANGPAAAGSLGNGHSAYGSPASNGRPPARPGTAAGALPQLLAGQWQLLLRPEYRAAWQPVRPLLASRTVRTRLLAGLAEAEFWPLLRQLYPGHYRLAFRLAADWQLLARQGLVKLSAPALFEVLLALIQSTPVASWRPETAVRTLLAAEETLWPQASTRRGHSRAGQLLAAIGRRGLVLRGPLGALLLLHQQAGQAAKPTPPATPIPFIKEEDRPLETVYLANAGLVLLWPFLTMLFDRLGYLENQQFRDEASRARAALLLQFLVSGAAAVPEYQLPLNKLLCGIAQSQPLPRELPLTAAETELGESLLKAVIARWDALKNTSIAGLRETFLLRPGKLDWLPDDRIVLTVEPKTLDILLDRRPWSISIIKLPWMAAPLYVTWR